MIQDFPPPLVEVHASILLILVADVTIGVLIPGLCTRVISGPSSYVHPLPEMDASHAVICHDGCSLLTEHELIRHGDELFAVELAPVRPHPRIKRAVIYTPVELVDLA